MKQEEWLLPVMMELSAIGNFDMITLLYSMISLNFMIVSIENKLKLLE